MVKYTYDGADVLLDQQSWKTTKYINGAGIDNKLRQTANGQSSYYLSDHLGSTVALVDSTGTVTSSTRYDSFGNATNTNFASRYQFTGREYDANIGMYYYRARWYSSDLGRFISEDPIGFRGGDVNLYGYVRNNPQNFVDPTGHFPVVLIGRFTPYSLDEIQTYLGFIGLIPGLGEPADAVDGAISAARGEYVDAGLSGASMIPFAGIPAGTTKICRRLKKLQSKFDDLAENNLLPKFREIDPDLTVGYTGSFKTGTVGNPNKPTYGQPIDFDNFDIDFWIKSDALHQQKGNGIKAEPDFRKLLSETPGFEGLRPNKKGFSIRFVPSDK